jgi:predicted membrane protein (TIGR00267 family)
MPWLSHPRARLDIVAGLIDGILTALTLTASKLLSSAASIEANLALRVGAAAGATTIFVFFVAHYAELRAELIRAERQLNLRHRGRLLAGDLGDQIFREALAGAMLAAFCSVLGALCPIVLALALPSPRWLGCLVTILVLGALGMALAQSFYGSRIRWSAMLMAGGIISAVLGGYLNIAT